jgi:hypothetical protein
MHPPSEAGPWLRPHVHPPDLITSDPIEGPHDVRDRLERGPVRLRDLWPFGRATIDPRLFDWWHRVDSDGPTDGYAEAELELRDDGTMLRAMSDGNTWRIVELTYRIDGSVLIFGDRSGCGDNRMGFKFENDNLLRLDTQNGCAWYERGSRQRRSTSSGATSSQARRGQ